MSPCTADALSTWAIYEINPVDLAREKEKKLGKEKEKERFYDKRERLIKEAVSLPDTSKLGIL